MTRDAKKIAQATLLFLFFLFIVLYGFYVSRGLLIGVKIKNVVLNGTTAQSGTTVNQNITAVSGNAKNAVHLTVDGREISIDKDGNFNETIVLLPGYNIIEIEAKDKFGHIDTKDYQLIYKQQ